MKLSAIKLPKVFDFYLLVVFTLIQYELLAPFISSHLFNFLLSLTNSYVLMELIALGLIRMKERQALGKMGFKSMEEFTNYNKKMLENLVSFQKLPYNDQMTIVNKIQEITKEVSELSGKPEWFFKNNGTTREESLKRLQIDFNSWLKKNKYPEIKLEALRNI